MKLLYASGNSSNSRIQCARFLNAMSFFPQHQIKVSAYKRSSPKSQHIDWTLDALLNIFNPFKISWDNENIGIYLDQVKSYAPDLIISDLEFFTSEVASALNIPIWQCSSTLINSAILPLDKNDMGAYKFHIRLLEDNDNFHQRALNLFANAERSFICSHFGDVMVPPPIKSGFEWVRPYHTNAKVHSPCHHSVIAGLFANDKRVLHMLKRHPDSVVFLEAPSEIHQNIKVKDIDNQDEYYCNLRNSDIFICQGQSSFIADAFYNHKFPLIYPDYYDLEATINSHFTNKKGLGKIITHQVDDIFGIEQVIVKPQYQASIGYLDEHINRL